MASNLAKHQPLSSQACVRCYKRKKKCDRVIPSCASCSAAGKSCDYFDLSTGNYSVAYVTDLENRVAQLQAQLQATEGELKATLSQQATREQDWNQTRASNTGNSSSLGSKHLERESPGSEDNGGIPINGQSASERGQLSRKGSMNTPRDLADEFGTLSLSASAEGHYLGPGSGISFAKFTQSIIYQMDSKNEKLINNGVIIPIGSLNSNNGDSPDSGESGSPNNNILGLPDNISSLGIPNADRAVELAEFYWRHSHTLYPFIKKDSFMKKLAYMLNPDANSELAGIEEDPTWLFCLFMVLAIGSTSMASITVTSEDEAVACWQRAMFYLPDILSKGSRVALEGILLLVSYSFFNRMGPDTWYLVGIASRLALGMGLHTEKCLENLDVQEQEHVKRVFWCLYMMDRVVSTTLGRPMAIRDVDIDIPVFSTDVDSEHPVSSKSLLVVSRHFLYLRRIAGEILEEVYSVGKTKDKTDQERREVVDRLHHKMVEWRRNMPFPLNETHFTLVPHLTTAWFDLNYYNMVIMLFRPSPLWPQPPPENLRLVSDAASMALKQFHNMYRQQKLSFNWLNLLSVFCATLALLFITSQTNEGEETLFSPKEVLSDLKLSEELLTRFALKLAPAKACLTIVRGAMNDIKIRYNTGGTPVTWDGSNSNTNVGGAVPKTEPASDGVHYNVPNSAQTFVPDSPYLGAPTASSVASMVDSPNINPDGSNANLQSSQIDSVLSMFSMTNDTYYENLVSQIDMTLLNTVPMHVDSDFNYAGSNFFFDISEPH